MARALAHGAGPAPGSAEARANRARNRSRSRSRLQELRFVASESAPEAERPTRSVTLRLPRRLLQELRALAKEPDVPYQSLMKVLLAEKVAELRRRKAS